MSYENTFKRKELKYLLTPADLDAVQKAMEGHMQADAYGLSDIRNLYCDSPDFLLIRRSLERPDYKEKVRLRSYGIPTASDTVFLELKKKYNGIVYKRRQPLHLRESMAYLEHGVYPNCDTQVMQELNYTVRTWHLTPRIFLEYDRIAYYGIDDIEFRMTFDFNIRSRFTALQLDSNAPCTPLMDTPYALLEIKAAQAIPRWLADVLTQRRIYPTSFSKVGRAYQQMLAKQSQQKQCEGTEKSAKKGKKESSLCLKVS
jgi:SPX domain protein involved in polyphosphate accumulation